MPTGRPSKFTARTRTNLKKQVSQRRLGKKYEVHYSIICRQLVKMNIRYYKREKAPKYTKKQAERAQKLCRKLANLLYRSDNSLVFYEKKDFTFDGSFMLGYDNYYSDNRAECSDDVRYVGLEKFRLPSHFTQRSFRATFSSNKFFSHQIADLYQ